MKKMFATLIATIIAFGTFTGCTTDSEQNNKEIPLLMEETGGLTLPLTKENQPLTYIAVSSVNEPSNKYVFQKLKEITGIDLKVDAYPASTYIEKIKVIIASKNLPDIIGDGIGSITEINDIATQGAFAPVDDHMKEMPNFKKIFVEDPENKWVFKAYGASDGKLYGLPHYDTSRDVNHGMLYRKDVFDKHGIKMWNNPEEFYQVLKKLKELYPDSAPFTSKNGDNIFSQLSTSWGVVSHKPYYDEESGIWKDSDTDEKTKDMLQYLKKLYSEGLVDQEFLTLTQAAWSSKMTQPNKTFVTFDWIGRMDLFKEQTKETIPEYDLSYANPMGPKGTIITLPKVLPMFAAVANNKNAALSMKLMDFLYSPAGAELMTMGIKGETYEINEHNKATYIEFPEGKKVEMPELEEKYGLFMQGTYKRMDKRSTYFNYSKNEQAAQDKAVLENRLEPADPVLAFTPDETATITEYSSKLISAAKETFVNYILTDKSGESAWQAWLAKSKELGSDKVVQVYNDAWKRMQSQE